MQETNIQFENGGIKIVYKAKHGDQNLKDDKVKRYKQLFLKIEFMSCKNQIKCNNKVA